ncbi:GMC family oxidoreductase [Halospina sp. K52047b]|uniref:GMC family oxidoreductase n=1 Tax=Halospina sp. K52047b TaxID=2614160 RepID=UPI00124A221C|nr:GMC family oxidoreductase [Halospina sp. K52047b]KAA8983476.1 GMC family oxidoreductase [Halospina sp. K52047b]
MANFNLYGKGINDGWDVVDAALLEEDRTLEADVAIIGTGAGGGTTAEVLARAGLKVIMVEEGRLYHDPDFTMDEHKAYSRLYQEGMTRATADASIAILQGRCVGGSTTVNWTSSFRTPEQTLHHWQNTHGVQDCDPETLAPWFANRKQALNIQTWNVDPNRNNDILRDGCERMGWDWKTIPRNVRNCWNLGYCGMGCPTNAKQGTLVTSVPSALGDGATLIHSLRVDRLNHQGDRVRELRGTALGSDGVTVTGRRMRIRARHFVVAGSAIGSPGILLRSEVPDPYDRIGRRTFLHPVNATVARMPETVEPYYGAPQSIYSDEFLWRNGVTGSPGYKLEVPPLHPVMAAAVLPDHGEAMVEQARHFPQTQSIIALLRDGFNSDSEGGTVTLRDDNSPQLHYPISDSLWSAFRHAWLRMAEIQFAAGAEAVRPVHMDAPYWHSWKEAEQGIRELPLAELRARLFTAHQMGGCAMGDDPARSVVNSWGEHHHLSNLSVHDASIFPTSLGANPQLTVYALAARNSHRLAGRLQSNA